MGNFTRLLAAALVAIMAAATLCGAVDEKPAARAGKLDVTYYFLPG